MQTPAVTWSQSNPKGYDLLVEKRLLVYVPQCSEGV